MEFMVILKFEIEGGGNDLGKKDTSYGGYIQVVWLSTVVFLGFWVGILMMGRLGLGLADWQEIEKGNGVRMGRHRDIWKHGRAQQPLFGLGTLSYLAIR